MSKVTGVENKWEGEQILDDEEAQQQAVVARLRAKLEKGPCIVIQEKNIPVGEKCEWIEEAFANSKHTILYLADKDGDYPNQLLVLKALFHKPDNGGNLILVLSRPFGRGTDTKCYR